MDDFLNGFERFVANHCLLRDINRVLSCLVDKGFSFRNRNGSYRGWPYKHRRAREDLRRFPDLADCTHKQILSSMELMAPIAYECGELSRAVLAKSEARVTHCIEKLPNSILEREDDVGSPLYLSVGWPRGLELLLAAGAEVMGAKVMLPKGLFNQTPIEYACAKGCLESVKVLANAMNAPEFCRIWPRLLDLAITNKPSEPEYIELIQFIISAGV